MMAKKPIRTKATNKQASRKSAPSETAFLHIVHVSDVHYRHPTVYPDADIERRLYRATNAIRRINPKRADEYWDLWLQGTAKHDPFAHDLFCRFLCDFASDKEFRGIETWLLDTGDVSVQGDQTSIDTALGRLEDYRFALELRLGAEVRKLFLYGNHDAWPGQFPWFRTKVKVEKHRDAIRAKSFPKRWPVGPLTKKIPGTDASVQLWAVNSVIDDLIENLRAFGRIQEDPFWKDENERIDQLSELEYLVNKSNKDRVGARDFRILAVHHPIHYPPPAPSSSMVLLNAPDVALRIGDFAKQGRGPLAHLILSGHTHSLYPAHGDLKDSPEKMVHAPLAQGQLQLVVGSLMQVVRSADRARAQAQSFAPHQAQILTLLARGGDGGGLLVQRRLVGRPGGAGLYKFLTCPTPEPGIETVLFEY